MFLIVNYLFSKVLIVLGKSEVKFEMTTVKELIEKLSKMNPDEEVFIRDSHTMNFESSIQDVYYDEETGPYIVPGNEIRETSRNTEMR